MSPLVSICIPAWERPELLAQTVRSCLEQTYRAIEVLIADDSRSDLVADAIAAFGGDSRIRYHRNPQRLGQAGNTNKLFGLARGERLVLLHDDDILLPDAIETLAACWERHPTLNVSYGKHYIITHSGSPLYGLSAATARARYRSAQYAGIQKSPLWSVLSYQFPPDALMLKTETARAVGYRAFEDVGDACDVDFALRLAQYPGDFFFVDRYVSQYRITDVSVSTESHTLSHRYVLAHDLDVPPELEQIRQRYLDSAALSAVRRCLLHGLRREAWRLMWRPGASLRTRLACFGMVNLLLLALPQPVVRAIARVRHSLRIAFRRNNAVYRVQDLFYRYIHRTQKL